MNLKVIWESESLNCGKCEGKGKTNPWTSSSGKQYPARPCPFCDGSGKFAKPDVGQIVAAIKGRKGLRSKRPDDSRAYYVWRMARFHGGVDVTLPMTATLEVAGDPYLPILDIISDKVAIQVYGTDRAGARRWAGALGRQLPPDNSLPATAQPGGPVLLGDKPESEILELI